MSTSLNNSTTTIAPSISPRGAVNPNSVEFRSGMIARIAARMHEVPKDVVQFLCNPTQGVSRIHRADALSQLILELIQSSEHNESSAAALANQREEHVSIGLAHSLRWLYQFRSDFEDEFVERNLLKTLVPLYIAAGHGRVGSSLVETLSLLRTSCALYELDRITSNHDLAIWLRNCNPKLDPMESIQKSFRVCLDLMSKMFWREISKSASPNSASAHKSFESKGSPKLHSAWWSLATQLSNKQSQITVPAEIAVGVVAWDKLLDHWNQVLELMNENTQLPSLTTAKHIPTTLGSIAAETKVDTRITNSSNATKDKFDFANDHRFVEIRSAKDPQLSTILDQLLMHCRNEQGTLSLIVVKKLGQTTATSSTVLQNWQSKFIRYMDAQGESAKVRGFISDEGELSLVFQDVERSELAQWVRDSFAKFSQSGNSQLSTPVAQPLVCGVASVNAPSRSFKIDQLIQAAWRCLDGATSQGAGAVKTIEVY